MRHVVKRMDHRIRRDRADVYAELVALGDEAGIAMRGVECGPQGGQPLGGTSGGAT